MDPSERPWCSQLLKHEFFKKDNFGEKFAQELKAKITRETADNPLLKSIVGRHGDTKDDTAEEKARRKKRKEKVDFFFILSKKARDHEVEDLFYFSMCIFKQRFYAFLSI